MKRLETPAALAKSIPVSRLLWVYSLILVWAAVILFRLFQLQVLESELYVERAEQQRIGFISLSPRRGDILDRHHEDLAISVQLESVFAHPKDVEDIEEASRALAPILEQKPSEIRSKLNSGRSFIYLARKIDPRQSSAISALSLPGIYLQKESSRIYPNRELASHLLGFVGVDNEGLAGLEFLYNEQIRGQGARVMLRVDARRQSYTSRMESPARAGHSVVLNIDRSLQFIAERVLQETMKSTRALNGSAILMDPHTGEILALASYPYFNPNRYGDFDEETRRNRAILEIFEPGSTFKVITMSAVLNEGLAHPEEVIDCRVGTLRLAGKVYREAIRSYGDLSFREVLAKSSNVGTIKFGLRLGNDGLYDYIRRFGFGDKTGIELPGEQVGILRPPHQWSKISIGALAIGQEVGVTPLQMLRAFSVFANGGYLVRPHLLRRIVTPEGEVLYESHPERLQVLRSDTVARMRDALSAVVDSGTGKSARLSGYTSAGKTGTAQKFINGSYSRDRFIASYVGFAPLHEPALSAIVVINEPQGLYYGGQVAAPAFRQLMEQGLLHLKIPKDRVPPQPLARPEVASLELPSASGVSFIEEEPPLEQLEATIMSLLGEEPEEALGIERLALELNLLEVPDFQGMTLREVVRECTRLGLRLRVEGSGIAIDQRPAAGTQVLHDSLCEVLFSTETDRNASGRITGTSSFVSEQSRR